MGYLNRSHIFGIGLLALIVTVTALYHIFSFAVLCGVLSLIILMKHSTRKSKDIAHLMIIISFIPGIFFLLWPSGLYGAMIRDIVYIHFKISFPIFYSLIVGLFLSGFFLLFGINYAEEWLIRIIGTLKRRLSLVAPSHLFFLIVFVSVFFLILQYILLPACHKPIGIQEWRFYLLQLGNLIFLVLYCWGFSITAIEKASGLGTCDSEPYFSLSIAIGLLAVLSLIVTSYILDKNLPIRFINYWILFAAPVAYCGLSHLPVRVFGIIRILIPVGFVFSLLHAVKYSGWVPC